MSKNEPKSSLRLLFPVLFIRLQHLVTVDNLIAFNNVNLIALLFIRFIKN